MVAIFSIIIRTLAVYCCIVIGIRVFGKREISQLSVIDLVFILLISNAVQNAMVGPDNSLVGGITAAFTLFILNYVIGNLVYKSKKVSSFLQGNPLMLIYEGKIIIHHLRQAKISVEELEAVVREHGVNSIQDVNVAVLETDGNVSVLSNDYKNHSVRKRRAHKVISKNN